MTSMELGDHVFDTQDDDPDVAIVVRVPEEETIADWTYERNGKEISTTDENPDYSADAQLVNVTFVRDLKNEWPEWKDVAPAEFWDGVCDRSIPVYGFPEGRLGYVKPPATLEETIEQIQGNVDVLEWRLSEQYLHIEKMNETYAIRPDGSVSGNGIYADYLEELVANPNGEPTYKYQT